MKRVKTQNKPSNMSKNMRGGGNLFSLLKGESLGKLKKRIILISVFVAAVAVLLIGVHFKIRASQPPKLALSSMLFDALDIDELSTSSFIYNGIAEIYDEEGEKVLYSAVYHATVKAGISMQDIHLDVDEQHKTVHVSLPEIAIQSVSVDPSYIDFIPDKAEIDLTTVLSTCREDVKREAMESGKLISVAEENLRTVIEALTLPLIEDQGYTLEW